MSKAHTLDAVDYLAAEFIVVYTSRRGSVIHAAGCSGAKRFQRKAAAHIGALRHGAVIAPCCASHEARLINLGRRAGAL